MIVFQPPQVTYLQSKTQLIWLRTAQDSTIPAVFIDRKSKITIIFSHGNAEDIGCFYDSFCELAAEVGVNVLLYDYDGYGKATGQPTEQGCYDCIDAAYQFLTVTLRIPSEQIVLYGRSLGSGPSCYLAERLHREKKPLGGLILQVLQYNAFYGMIYYYILTVFMYEQAPLMSIFRVAFNFRFTLPYDMFANIDRIGGVGCPVFIIHGVKDEVVPFWHGQELFLAAPIALRARPLWVETGGHNNLEDLLV